MKNIKTSKSVRHYCRLNSCGALTHRCADQCNECKSKLTVENMARPTPEERVKDLKNRFNDKETIVGMVTAIIERTKSDLKYWKEVLDKL